MRTKPILEDIEQISTEYEGYLRSLRGKHVVVTGGNGFIPSYLIDTLAYFNNAHPGEAIHVTAINKNEVTQNSRLGHLLGDKHVSFKTHDVGTPFTLVDTPHVIIHAASRANPSFFKKNPADTFDANVTGARTLLEIARHSPLEKFLFFSSSEIYGNPPPEFLPTSETYGGNVNPLGELACYAEAKRAAETLCGIFFKQYGVPTQIARIFHTYGPGIRNDGKTITNIIEQVTQSGKIQLKSPGLERRSYMYVADCARALFDLLSKGKSGEAYNIGDDTQPISVRDISTMIRDKVNPSAVIHAPETYSEGDFIQDRSPDITKLRALGFLPNTSLSKGLDRLLDHVKETGAL